jgi:hypothetical protein
MRLSILCCSDKYRVNSPESGEQADVIHYCGATDRPNRLLITGNYSCSHILEIPRGPAEADRLTDTNKSLLCQNRGQSVSLTALQASNYLHLHGHFVGHQPLPQVPLLFAFHPNCPYMCITRAPTLHNNRKKA